MSERRNFNERAQFYQFGTAARAIDAAPDYVQNPGRRINREPIAIEEPSTHRKVDIFSIGVIVFTFLAVMFVGIIYLNLNFQSTYLSKNVIKLQREVVELEKSNDALAEQMEDGVNLKKIYKKATKLGMKPIRKSNIVTYTKKKSAEIRCYGEIPEM